LSECCLDLNDESFCSIAEDYAKLLVKRLEEIEKERNVILLQLETIRKNYNVKV